MERLSYNALFIDGVENKEFKQQFTKDFFCSFFSLPKQTEEYQFTYIPLKNKSGIFLESFFTTEGKPPLEQINALSLTYPTLSFDLYYYEHDFQFAGNHYVQNGRFYVQEEFRLGERYLWKFIKNKLEDVFDKTIIRLET